MYSWLSVFIFRIISRISCTFYLQQLGCFIKLDLLLDFISWHLLWEEQHMYYGYENQFVPGHQIKSIFLIK